MADLFLNWGDLGPYGTNLNDGDTVSVDTGGVAVNVAFTAQDAYATAFTFNADGYVGAEDDLNPNSFLKLYDDANNDGAPGTSTATLTFTALDTDNFTDQVQAVTFRINDIDMSTLNGDLSEANPNGFQDIVTINAYDAEGNLVPVTMTAESAVSVTGQTATGTTEGTFTDATGSILVTIDQPVQRIEIVYENGDLAQQGVTVSDVHFSTVDTGENLPPVAGDDLATTPEDTAIIIDVLTNDSDPEDGTLTVTGASVDIGSVVVNPDNTLTYTPPADYNGPATITYTIEDPEGNAATGEVAVTVEPVNDDPVAVDDADTTPEGVAVTITDPSSNDTDVDGDPLTTASVGTPTNGTAVLNPDGTVTYTPNAGFVGEDTIPYTVDDGNGGTDTGEIVVTVTPAGNTDPDAVDDSGTTAVDTPVILTVLANDTDPEGDTLSTASVGTPLNGSAVLNADDTVTYTPDTGFTGTDSFEYTISDGNGGTDTATVTVTVTDEPNTDPDAVDDTGVTTVDTPVILTVLANDTDPENDLLTTTGATVPANGSVAVNPDGTITYTPNTGFTGTDTFDYTIDDGNGGTDTATVTVIVDDGTNTPPVAFDDSETTGVDTPIIIDPKANDVDAEDPTANLSVVAIGTPTNGTAVLNADGTVTYTPNAGFTGTDTFTYELRDTGGLGDQGTVTVTVSDDPNTDPDAVDDASTTTVGTPVLIDVLGNDTDPDGDPLTTNGTTDPANGSVALNPDGTVTYTPDTGFTGTDTFDYTISDGNGGTDTATVTVTVDPAANEDPTAVDDEVETPEDTPITLDPTANDTDPNGDPVVCIAVGTPTNGTATLNPDGTVTYTPNPDFVGEDTIPYTIDDGNGGTDTGEIVVTVTPENDDPTAVDDSATTPEDTAIVIPDPAANDTDPDGDPLTVTSVGTPTNGTATLNPDGTVTYTPNPDFVGEDTIPYTVDDGNGGTDTGEIVVTVTPEGNTDPDAVDDSGTTAVDTPVILDVLRNDTDPESDPLTTTGATEPANGTVAVNADGTITYTPDTGFTGTDTFDYTIDDGNGGTDTATVTVTVTDDPNQAPTAVDDIATTEEDTPVIIPNPAGNDTDPDGDPLTVTSIGTPTNGTATLNPDGTVTYTPDPDYIGTDTIPYTVDDGNGGTDTGEIVVTVTPEDLGRIDTDIFPVDPTLQDQDPFNGFDEDPDPSDDLDSIDGTSSSDVISTGDDDDTIRAGGGSDVVNPGIDDDLVYLGAGNDYLFDPQGADTIYGGSGNDTIIAGSNTFSNYEGDDPFFPTLGFSSDPNTDDGRDYVEGNNGDDYIETGDDDDTIDGGQGNDTIDGGIDDDLITGNMGNDSLLGGHGSDTIDGGQDDDYIDGSAPAELELTDDIDVNTENDRDSLIGALGNDTILGGDDDDTLRGGSGNDVLDGGIDDDLMFGGNDDDTLIGGQGNDTLNGGSGADSISGGADRDVIIVDSAADGTDDTVDGGAEGDDFDVLDLTGVGVRGEDWRIVDTSPDSNGNGIDGTVEFLNGAGEVTGTMDFFEIEEVVPCFTPGTLIATPQGERLVEELQVGDRVITRDNGIQEIKWIGRKDLTGHDLARKPHFKPILIQKGALGNNLPEHDMLVSPNHRILVANDKTALYFEEREVLVAAKHLVGLEGVDEVESLGVAYIHVMFEQHEVILSNGAWTESFQPGDYTLKGIGNAQRQEIFELFPELEHAEGLKAYGAARRSLKKHEAHLLTK
ncbi:Ig-like domain-containing protein [Tropicibacter oceani]|uniref:Ig-like domain-containing protein n=1 Tax=Tropicibacter oceani TaxID=3058420 RepID=A0ABY8QDW6_9RHOB|nr:Ig-like domain-containing protein [Tropicibacter oceani]WGW02775.1 Ig-like domain-containing protein [Tropicibacter oceani]